MKRAADHDTKVLLIEAGCFVCHHGDARWTAANAMAVAARHARRYGHRTWARQSIEVQYGPKQAPIGDPLPGLLPPEPIQEQQKLVPDDGTSHHDA